MVDAISRVPSVSGLCVPVARTSVFTLWETEPLRCTKSNLPRTKSMLAKNTKKKYFADGIFQQVRDMLSSLKRHETRADISSEA